MHLTTEKNETPVSGSSYLFWMWEYNEGRTYFFFRIDTCLVKSMGSSRRDLLKTNGWGSVLKNNLNMHYSLIFQGRPCLVSSMVSSRQDLLKLMAEYKFRSILKNNLNMHYSLIFQGRPCLVSSMVSSRQDLLKLMAEYKFRSILKNNLNTHYSLIC